MNEIEAPQPITQASGLTGLQKAAALLTALGEQTSAQIIKHLTEEEVQRVSQAVAQMATLKSADAEAVLEEFQALLLARRYVVKGGLEYAEVMLQNAFGPDAAVRLLDRVKMFIASDMSSFDALQKADPQQLAKFIHNEHPQTVALILSHLAVPQAAVLLSSLPSDLRTDVTMRMAHLDQISPEIITKIAGVLGEKLKSLGEVVHESYGGVRAVANLLNRLEGGVRNDILGSVEQGDPNLFATIRHLMFVFEDLIILDERDLKELIQKVDRKLLTVALKGTSDQLKNKILSSMSQRAADILREDIEVLGAVKIREVEAAQSQIIAQVREMEQEGVITLQQTEYVM